MSRRLLNIVARQRVQVDAARYIEEFGITEAQIPDHLRDYMVQLALDSHAAGAGAISDARRDRL